MKKIINSFKKSYKGTKFKTKITDKKVNVKKAAEATMLRYKQTFKDLARYDRDERGFRLN